MYRLSKFDELIARDYKERKDVKDYLTEKQKIMDTNDKKK